MDTLFQNARHILKENLAGLLQLRNVQACGLGYKVSDGKRLDKLSLVVSVTRKLPVSQLAPRDRVPSEVGGIVTDVVATGEFRVFTPLDPKARYRPAQPGASVGHYRITAGTIGFIVYKNGAPYILSNNHVLANSNNCQVGDPIYQPGPSDGGTAADRIGTLADFVPIDFGEENAECPIATNLAHMLNFIAKMTGSRHRLHAVQQTPGINMMDAALALPDNASLVDPSVLGLGSITGVGNPVLGMQVQKMGRTTGLTQGMVTQVNVTVKVNYDGQVVNFSEQVFTEGMSLPGDSGSGILDMGRKAVGLLFAGSESTTIFTPLPIILDRFGVTLTPA